MLWMYLKQHPDIAESCGLDTTIPDRRTIDRRFCNLDLSCIIGDIGKHFIKTGLVESKTTAVDSTLVPAARLYGIQKIKLEITHLYLVLTSLQRGITGAKKWIYGYKTHVLYSVGKLVVPLAARFTGGNISDKNMYESLVSLFGGIELDVLVDGGYDSDKLYKLTEKLRMRLIAVINKIGKSTARERKRRYNFFKSPEGQALHRQRKHTIEPLFEILKSTFGTRHLDVRGKQVETYVLSCVLTYQLAVYYNCVTGQDSPRVVRPMLGQ